jgi:hypothetical protein
MLPKLDELTKDWRSLVELDQFTLLALSPFGDLFMRDMSDAYCLLDINMGELAYADQAGSDPAILFPFAFDMRIAIRYIESGLLPVDGQCFGYKKQLVTGGSLEIENVYVATEAEYISFMGDFHRQIRDVPDGGTIRIKVINQKVIQFAQRWAKLHAEHFVLRGQTILRRPPSTVRWRGFRNWIRLRWKT